MIFIVGVQKAGTSSLHECLVQHSQIDQARFQLPGTSKHAPKEMHFFGNSKRSGLGRQWYLSHFASNGRLKLESTPEYIESSQALREIREFDPGARIILLLRDPLDRAVSAWKHWQRLPQREKWPVSKPERGFVENLRFEMLHWLKRGGNASFFSRGLYYRSLQRLYSMFHPAQVKVMFLEELRDNTSDVLSDVQTWLGLSYEPLRLGKVNAGEPTDLGVGEGDLRDIWLVYNRANATLSREFRIRHPWAGSWESWIGGRTVGGVAGADPQRSLRNICERARRAIAGRRLGGERLVKLPAGLANRNELLGPVFEAHGRSEFQALLAIDNEPLWLEAWAGLFRLSSPRGQDLINVLKEVRDPSLVAKALRILVQYGWEEEAMELWLELGVDMP